MANGNDLFYRQIPKTGNPTLDNETFKENILKGLFPNRRLYLPHIPKKLKNVIKKCIEPNPNNRYDNTLQIINDLASIDKNLDIRYGKNGKDEFWESPKGAYVYKINLIHKTVHFFHLKFG